MRVNAIAAIGKNRQMGLMGRLPWRNPEDLKFYYDTVIGKTIVCGRLTYEGLPKSIREGCEVLVISRTKQNVPTFETIEEALDYADTDEVWICGGSKIYEHCIENNILDELWLSYINYSGYADVLFPEYRTWAQGASTDSISFGTFKVEKMRHSIPVEKKAHKKRDITLGSNGLDNYLGGLTFRDSRPSEPSLGDVFYDQATGVMNFYADNGWQTIAETESIPDRVVATPVTAEHINAEILEALESFVGEPNSPRTRAAMADVVQRTVADLHDQGVNDVNVTSDFNENDGTINVEINFRPNQSLEVIQINTTLDI